MIEKNNINKYWNTMRLLPCYFISDNFLFFFFLFNIENDSFFFYTNQENIKSKN